MLSHWSSIVSEPSVPTTVQNQVMFNNFHIRIAGKIVHKWSNEALFVGDFFNNDGSLKSWSSFKNEKKIK